MLTRVTVVLAVLGSAAPAGAEPPAPDDFAAGFHLELEGDSALWQLELPDDVYRTVTRSDLGDVRVFNGAGETVPHALQPPEAPRTAPDDPAGLPFFALRPREADEHRRETALRVVTDEQGAIVDVMSGAGAADDPDEKARIGAWLIDASGVDHAIRELSLEWERSAGEDFAITVDVESSENLVDWRHQTRVTLADLRTGERALVHSDIPLPHVHAKYLRLSWPQSVRAVRLTAVRASFGAVQQALPRRWQRVVGAPTAQTPGAFEFDTKGFWPVDRIRLSLPADNSVVQGEVASRPGADAPWRTQARGVFYRLHQNGLEFRSEPLVLEAGISHPHWRLETTGVPGSGTPVLELGWVPHRLTFVAQGTPPFTLAYGSAKVGRSAEPVRELLGEIEGEQKTALVRTARLGNAVSLGGPDRLASAPPLPVRRWLLWAVLVLGVVLLAWMVRSSYRQMKAA